MYVINPNSYTWKHRVNMSSKYGTYEAVTAFQSKAHIFRELFPLCPGAGGKDLVSLGTSIAFTLRQTFAIFGHTRATLTLAVAGVEG